MIDKFFNGVVEQVYSQIGRTDKNIVMASYSNDFSASDLEKIKRYSSERDNVFFAFHEFGYDDIHGAYTPFLDIINEMLGEYYEGSIDTLLDECGVYYLHRPLFKSFHDTGICVRNEGVLVDEVDYEKKKMTEGIAGMLFRLSEYKPIVIVLNRFHLASKSTMVLVNYLIEHPTDRIGIVMGTNEIRTHQDSVSEDWWKIYERLEDRNCVYHIGSTGRMREGIRDPYLDKINNLSGVYTQISNAIEMLDFDHAYYHLSRLDRRLKQLNIDLENKWLVKFGYLYIKTAIMMEDFAKALDVIRHLNALEAALHDHEIKYNCAYFKAMCYMYQGKLKAALKRNKEAIDEADILGNEEMLFKAELLEVMIKMSGWYNIFFLVKDIEIDEELIEKLIKYRYENHLAHIYVYAYDNEPNMVAKAYESEKNLVHFSKGIELAKKIGNEELVYNAYQKNVMIASTNGMNEIALLYSIRTYQSIDNFVSLTGGRVFSAIGYNLCALRYNDYVDAYYNRALEVFYETKNAADVAEIKYNFAINYIMLGEYDKAEHVLQFAMKTVERLHLNSLRVCNLSKLYALLALVSILQGQKFNGERYILSCKHFLNYILEKQDELSNNDIVHDYTICDDDMFLYSFANALLDMVNEKYDRALEWFGSAEQYLAKTEGNQFYIYKVYRKKRIELFRKCNMTELMEKEEALLREKEEAFDNTDKGVIKKLLEESTIENVPCRVRDQQLEALIKQVGVEKDYRNLKKQSDFFANWQKQLAVTEDKGSDLVESLINTFSNYFNNDCTVFIRYNSNGAETLFNNTNIEITDEVKAGILNSIKNYPDGFAVSKISDTFSDHLDMIKYFGVDNVCSLVAAPCYSDGRIESVFITYVLMKDNWHVYINRYMLDESDLSIYRLLFRELNYSLNRIEDTRKIYEMNKLLEQNSVTDMLTGLYNRNGLYREVARIEANEKDTISETGVGLMFVDLDNFKPYNDILGHDIGDIVLQGMAGIFKDVVEDNGFACRYGGDEFILIFKTADKTVLEEIAKSIYNRIEKAAGFRSEIEERLGKSVEFSKDSRIGCSIGIATADSVGSDSIDSMIKAADDILYTVKAKAKGTYAFI